jgi:hypothetical protein
VSGFTSSRKALLMALLETRFAASREPFLVAFVDARFPAGGEPFFVALLETGFTAGGKPFLEALVKTRFAASRDAFLVALLVPGFPAGLEAFVARLLPRSGDDVLELGAYGAFRAQPRFGGRFIAFGPCRGGQFLYDGLRLSIDLDAQALGQRVKGSFELVVKRHECDRLAPVKVVRARERLACQPKRSSGRWSAFVVTPLRRDSFRVSRRSLACRAEARPRSIRAKAGGGGIRTPVRKCKTEGILRCIAVPEFSPLA